jgi:hypothetical protein
MSAERIAKLQADAAKMARAVIGSYMTLRFKTGGKASRTATATGQIVKAQALPPRERTMSMVAQWRITIRLKSGKEISGVVEALPQPARADWKAANEAVKAATPTDQKG